MDSILSPVFGMHVQIHGHLEKDGEKLDKPTFHGKWDEALYADLADGSERLLWKVNPVPTGENRSSFSHKHTLCGRTHHIMRMSRALTPFIG